MDFLRLIWTQLLGLLIFLFFLWLIALKTRKFIENETGANTVKIGRWITIVVLIFAAIWAIRIASINEVPRSVIDRSNAEHMINSFDERTQKEAAQTKQVDTIKTQTNQKLKTETNEKKK